jgi:hypothetical protein
MDGSAMDEIRKSDRGDGWMLYEGSGVLNFSLLFSLSGGGLTCNLGVLRSPMTRKSIDALLRFTRYIPSKRYSKLRKILCLA